MNQVVLNITVDDLVSRKWRMDDLVAIMRIMNNNHFESMNLNDGSITRQGNIGNWNYLMRKGIDIDVVISHATEKKLFWLVGKHDEDVIRTVTSEGVGVADLNANGERWEGDLKGGKPFGCGILYNAEGKVLYKGFMINGIKDGYGIEYYDDIEKVKYDGCFCNDRHFGLGTMFDRNGEVYYDGLWKNDEPCSSESDGNTIDSTTTLVSIPNNTFNQLLSFSLAARFGSLTSIVIGDECFGTVRSFIITGLIQLKSIVIGNKSFTYAKTDDTIKRSNRNDGTFQIVECPKLKSIRIGDYSFSDYRIFEWNNLPSLKTVTIGNSCFYYSQSFPLNGMTHLKTIAIGDDCFGAIRSFIITGLIQLKSIVIGNKSFTYAKTDDTIKRSNRNDGTFQIVECPKLKSIRIGDYSFSDYRIFEWNNLPSLKTVTIGNSCFYYSQSFPLNGMTHLKTIAIGDDCFGAIRSVEINGLNKLIKVTIGKKSFTSAKTANEIKTINRTDGSNRILNCPKLKSIRIGEYSFSDYHVFEWNGLPSLKSVTIGNYCYHSVTANTISWDGMTQLKSIVIGDECFEAVRSFLVNGLNELKHIVIGKNSFTYAKTDRSVGTSKQTDGVFQVKACSNLNTLMIGHYSFSDYHSFEWNSLPSLKTMTVGSNCFYGAKELYITGLNDCIVDTNRVFCFGINQPR